MANEPQVMRPQHGPFPYGLSSVIEASGGWGTLADDAEQGGSGQNQRLQNGMQWESVVGAQFGITDNKCVTPSTPALQTARYCNWKSYAAFTVYLRSRHDMIDGDVARSNHVAMWEAGEMAAMEAQFLANMRTASADITPTWPTATTEAQDRVRLAIGVLSQTAKNDVLPVLYVPRNAAEIAGTLRASGSVMRTAMGVPVVVGSLSQGTGFASPADGAEVYTTGPLKGHRGPVDLQGPLDERESNDVIFLSQRTYVIGWEYTPSRIDITFG